MRAQQSAILSCPDFSSSCLRLLVVGPKVHGAATQIQDGGRPRVTDDRQRIVTIAAIMQRSAKMASNFDNRQKQSILIPWSVIGRV